MKETEAQGDWGLLVVIQHVQVKAPLDHNVIQRFPCHLIKELILEKSQFKKKIILVPSSLGITLHSSILKCG